MKRGFSWPLFHWCLLLFSVAQVVDSNSPNCCQKLKSVLAGKVQFPNDPSYAVSNKAYWSAQEESLKPNCFVKPASAQDVSTALKTLYALKTCKFAVKSGGHMAHAGAANIQDGVTIDLGGLQQFRVNKGKAKTTATIGPGLRWGDVYTKLTPYGLAAPGGRSSEVGVGGYLLGGGSSYFIPHGFGCDNVVAYQIVLADGTILDVTLLSHGDLFKALKGGSNNFGIVTSYTILTFKLGGIWGGNIIYPGSTADQQLKAFNQFASNPNFDVNAAAQMSLSYSSVAGSIFVVQPFYARPQVNPPALQPFTNIKPQLANMASLNTLAPFAIEDGKLSPDGSQQMTWTLSIQNDLGTLEALYKAFNASISSIANVSGIGWSVTLEPVPKTFLEASTNLGGNVLGISSKQKGNALILCDSSFSWTSTSDTATVRKAGLKLLDDIVQAAKQRGTYNRWIDVNHADFTQDPIASFGPLNKAFLERVSRRYDPKQVFQRQVPGGFKIFR